MAANDKQIGGGHYRKPVQHWDWAQYLPYLEGNCTKYVGRHDSKHGIEDLKKAVHYIQKIIERDYPGFVLEWDLTSQEEIIEDSVRRAAIAAATAGLTPDSNYTNQDPDLKGDQ
jgi:hypothetical protein